MYNAKITHCERKCITDSSHFSHLIQDSKEFPILSVLHEDFFLSQNWVMWLQTWNKCEYSLDFFSSVFFCVWDIDIDKFRTDIYFKWSFLIEGPSWIVKLLFSIQFLTQIDLSTWRSTLKTKKLKFNLEKYINLLRSCPLPNLGNIRFFQKYTF